MVKKKMDNRIRVLIENGVTLGHRSLFVIVGEKAKDQVVILHHMLSKATVKARPNVLWCYKKDLGFSSHRKNRMKHIQRKLKAGKVNLKDDDPFEIFVSSTDIRYCYYSETQKILGNTYGMCILQDFEAITPNLLARTIETVEGGGIIAILLQSVTSFRQLFTLNMDVHERYRTEAHDVVVGRFNERFLLSLGSCSRCLVLDDRLTVLPITSKNVLNVTPVDKQSAVPQNDQELLSLKDNLRDTQPVSCLINCCKTLDQAKALLKFVDAISEKSLTSTVSLTASRGRGKSAALGLAVSCAIAFSYSNIFVTSPSPENLKTFFEFVFKGLDALAYQEHLDYSVVQSTNPEYNKALVRVNIYKNHRQTIQYIHPTDVQKLSHTELLVIDEAAAIPLPYVKAMLGPYLVFLASTINGYEGTGRSLSLKLLQQLRTQSSPSGCNSKSDKKMNQPAVTGRTLYEVTLSESIRYQTNDAVEKWLTDLLCLDATLVKPILSGCPPPDSCDLYYINRDSLFCYHQLSETFLQRVVSLFVASHYKNSPNDLQMMSDAPAHHLFCLLGPINIKTNSLPEVLCVIQVCLEGEISKKSITDGLSRGKRASGDLIPWTIAQQYQDQDFPSLAGARIVRIATHPDYQSMGYGKRALSLLKIYYEGKIPNIEENERSHESVESVLDSEIGLLEETIEPRKNLPPLLLKLSERIPEHLDYIGVSYGVTAELLKFWKRADFVPVYIRQTPNELTAEHSCIMLADLNVDVENIQKQSNKWLPAYWTDFRRRFVSLLAYQFNSFHTSLALGVINNNASVLKTVKSCEGTRLTKSELLIHMTTYDIKRLEMYCHNLVDYHLVIDLMPTLAKLYFLNKMPDIHLSAVQSGILLGLGLQYKTVDFLTTELDLPASQLLGLFNRSIRRIIQYITNILEEAVESTLNEPSVPTMTPLNVTLNQELEETAKVLEKKQKAELKKLKTENLEQYAIKGSETEWGSVLSDSLNKSIVSIKSAEKKRILEQSAISHHNDADDFSEKKRGKYKMMKKSSDADGFSEKKRGKYKMMKKKSNK